MRRDLNKWIGTAVDVIPGLAQECRPKSTWYYKTPDWIVSQIKLDTKERCAWITGRLETGEHFHWRFPASELTGMDYRYDLTECDMEIGHHVRWWHSEVSPHA